MALDPAGIGRTLPPYVVDVERGRLRAFADVIGLDDPCYVDLDAARAAGPAKETVDAIVGAGGQATAVAGDVTNPTFADRFVGAAVDAYGGLDIVVNNAGYTWDSVVQKTTDEQWAAMLDVHLNASFRILRAAQPVIAEPARQEAAEHSTAVGRRVVNVSSPGGVGAAMKPPVFLSPGTTMTTQVDGVGELVNRCLPPLELPASQAG